jgi:D-3-phosphoglycerate dehydrogenase
MSDRFKVTLVSNDAPDLPDWVPAELAEHAIEFVYHECITREDVEEHAADADIVWLLGGAGESGACLWRGNMQALKKCGAIVRAGSGTDNIPVQEATEMGIIVSNTPHSVAGQVADHTIGLIFSVIRQTVVQDRLVRQGIWERYRGCPRWSLQGCTLGLVGFGLIAHLVLEKLSGYEMNVLAYDPFVDEETMQSAGARKTELDELLRESDIVSLHCPLVDATHHLMGEEQFGMMKKQGIFINTSRGPVVDEQAMIRALSEGWIEAAGLDVLDPEPPAADNPLLKMDQVVITPHIGAHSDMFWDSMFRYSMKAIHAFHEGRWPLSWVNKNVKPKWKLT